MYQTYFNCHCVDYSIQRLDANASLFVYFNTGSCFPFIAYVGMQLDVPTVGSIKL